MKEFIDERQKEQESMTESMDFYSNEMNVVQAENSGLGERCQLGEGRLARLEKVVAELQAEITDLKSRSIRNNLVLYNIEQMQEKDQAENKDGQS